jgi:hypothetical protein
VAGGSLDVALRALSGVREAIKALRLATAKVSQDPILISLADATAEVATMWEMDRDEALAFYGVPKEYRTDELHIKVQLSFGGGPDVRVYDRAGKLVWRKPSTPGPRQPRRTLPHEEPRGRQWPPLSSSRCFCSSPRISRSDTRTSTAGAIRVAARRISELEATATLPDACERCGARLDQKPRGRPRRFCSERCRRKSAGNGSVDHNALEQAIWARKEGDLDDLIHHSDRGSQYLSIRYTEKVAEAGGVQRVGGRGDSYDNALAESVIALFKG